MQEEQPRTNPQDQPQSAAATNIEAEMEGLRKQQTKRPKGEKLELLKREDVRTMEKDLGRLRAQQAAQEQARIEAVSQNTELEEPEHLADTLLAGNHTRLSSEAPLPPPPSKARQIVTRALVTAIILFAAANLLIFIIWIWNR